MPPRYSYWTILAGGLPTAFRAAERADLLPTFNRIREKHPDAEMKWFARGRLWQSPDEAQADLQRARVRRDRDWRPGGDHRDPREAFKNKRKREVGRREHASGRPPSRPAALSDTRTAPPPSKPTGPSGERTTGPSSKPTGPSGTRTASPSSKPTGPSAKRAAWSPAKPTGPSDKRAARPPAKPTGPSGKRAAWSPSKPTGPSGKRSAWSPSKPTGPSAKRAAWSPSKPASTNRRTGPAPKRRSR